MNKTILQGKWRQVRGGLKTRWAKLTDDDRRLLDGKIDQMVGLFEERYGYTQQGAAHALAHYLGRYGKSRRRAARGWILVLSAVGLVSFVTAGGFALARVLSARREATGMEFAGQDSFASPKI